MVFLIQESQNKDSVAVHLKLNELLVANREASNNRMIGIGIEQLDEKDLRKLAAHHTCVDLLFSYRLLPARLARRRRGGSRHRCIGPGLGYLPGVFRSFPFYRCSRLRPCRSGNFICSAKKHAHKRIFHNGSSFCETRICHLTSRVELHGGRPAQPGSCLSNSFTACPEQALNQTFLAAMRR